MNTKRRIHDAIVGAVLVLLVPGLLGAVLFQSGITGFCPLYFVPDRTCPAEAR